MAVSITVTGDRSLQVGSQTIEGEALDDGTDDHDARAKHDAPSSTEVIVDQGDEW